jgi:hypothetical protein
VPATTWVAIGFWGLLWAGFCCGLCVGQWRASARQLGWAALACAVHAYTILLVPLWAVWVHRLGFESVWLHTLASENWAGKGIGALCSLGWVYALRRATPAAAGLVRPAPGSVRAVLPAVVVVAVALLGEAYLSRYGFMPLTKSQHLYYLTMPGLDEELFYRGALLALLAPGLPRRLSFAGTRTSWGGVVGVVLFTLGHGLSFPERLFDLGFGANLWFYVREWWSPAHFPLRVVLFQLGMSTFFLWVRERTGSTWAAVVVHCLMNGCLALGHAAS